MSKSQSSARGGSRASRTTGGTSRRTGRSRSLSSGKQPSSGVRWGRLLLRIVLVGLVLFAGWLVYLDATVRTKFEGKRWAVPAKVFGRPLELFDGQTLTLQGLKTELDQLGYQRTSRVDSPGTYAVSGSRVELHTRGFRFPDGAESAVQVSFRIDDGVVLNFGARSGGAVYSTRLDPLLIGGIYPAHREDRILVQLEEVPPMLPTALMLVEDRQFYEHMGIAPLAIARAMWANIRAGRVVQGGSTLTQQLVKNFYLTNERSLVRKANEAFMSILLDAHYSKDEILEAYLNEVFLGQAGDRAIHGFGMAAQFYFGQPLTELSIDKIAMLVGVVKGASYYNPRRHPERVMARRNLVLDLLAQEGAISANEAIKYKGRPLGVINTPSYSGARYPAFMDLVKQQLVTEYQEEDLQSEGLRIFTTLDPIVQEQAERSLRDGVKRLQQTAAKTTELQGAVVVTGTESGEVLAMVGGKESSFAGFNRALEAVRPIGSLVKPAIYLTALMQPERYTLVTPIQDKPFMIKLENGQPWQPKNYDGQEYGDIQLHYALTRSLNLATVRLGLDVTLPSVVDTLQRLGVERNISPYPSMLLGSLSLTPFEVARMYQTIASSGFNTPLRVIRAVTTPQGEVLSRYPFETQQVVPYDAVHLLQHGLQAVMREGTGRRVYSQVPASLAMAGKTGTTNDQRDSWFAGFTGDHLAVVWLGRDDNGPTRLTGSSGALTVWADLIGALPEHSFTSSKPDNVEYIWVDVQTGLLSDEHCEGSRYLPFIKGSEPQTRAPSCPAGGNLQNWIRGWFE